MASLPGKYLKTHILNHFFKSESSTVPSQYRRAFSSNAANINVAPVVQGGSAPTASTKPSTAAASQEKPISVSRANPTRSNIVSLLYPPSGAPQAKPYIRQ